MTVYYILYLDFTFNRGLAEVQSNQRMHDLYATMHIFQMALPDAFGQYRVKFFLNIIEKLRFLRY